MLSARFQGILSYKDFIVTNKSVTAAQIIDAEVGLLKLMLKTGVAGYEKLIREAALQIKDPTALATLYYGASVLSFHLSQVTDEVKAMTKNAENN